MILRLRALLGAALLPGLLCLSFLSYGFEWEGRVDRLSRELTTADAGRRRDIIRLLASYPADRVRGAILGALTDPDDDVRAEAARTAGQVGLREAVPELVEWLSDLDTDVRQNAARALGQIGERSVISNLVRVLGDASPEVRIAALEALARLGGREATVPVMGRLDDDDAVVRAAATRAVLTLDDEARARAIVPLIGRARDDAPEVRAAAFAALGELADDRAVPALVQGVRDGVPDVRVAAVSALGRIGSSRAIDPLARLLDEPEQRLSRAALHALAPLPDPRAAEAIIDVLTRHAAIQGAAFVALVHRADVLPNDHTLPGALARRLGSASHADATSLLRVLQSVTARRPAPDIVPALLATLAQSRGDIGALLRCLGQSGHSDALVPLLRHVGHEDAAVQTAALAGLEAYLDVAGSDGRAADPLMRALTNATGENQRTIVRLLGRSQAERSLSVLRPLLDHQDAALRTAAVGAIGAIGDPSGAPLLVPLLDDTDAATRFAAAMALGAVVDAAGLRLLWERLGSREPTDRHAIVSAIAEAAARVDPTLDASARSSMADALTRWLRAPDRRLSARVLHALARWNAPVARRSVLQIAEHDSGALRRQALALLGEVEGADARALARGALGDSDPRVVAAAASGFAGPAAAENVGPEDVAALFAAASRPWPAPGAASGALARLAVLGQLTAAQAAPACALATRREAFVRSNMLIILAVSGAERCQQPIPADSWMTPQHAPVVRAASAIYLQRAAAAGWLPSAAWERVLADCTERDLSDSVRHACSTAAERAPAEPVQARVYVYSGDGARLLRDHLTALRFSDGTSWMGFSDLNGLMYLGNAPNGPVWIEDPASTPLEP